MTTLMLDASLVSTRPKQSASTTAMAGATNASTLPGFKNPGPVIARSKRSNELFHTNQQIPSQPFRPPTTTRTGAASWVNGTQRRNVSTSVEEGVIAISSPISNETSGCVSAHGTKLNLELLPLRHQAPPTIRNPKRTARKLLPMTRRTRGRRMMPTHDVSMASTGRMPNANVTAVVEVTVTLSPTCASIGCASAPKR